MKSKIMALLAMAMVFLLAAPASAEPTRPFQLELGIGASWGTDARTLGFDGFVGYYHSLIALNDHWSFFGAVGPNLQVGELTVDVPNSERAVSASRLGIGPMTRVGFAYGDDSWADFYSYIGAAPIWASIDGQDYELGTRLSVGVSWPGSWGGIYSAMDDEDTGNCDGGTCGVGMLMLAFGWLLPNTVEFNIDDVARESVPTRYGVALKWSF